jgi:Zn-finger nucleic acid-binding protein
MKAVTVGRSALQECPGCAGLWVDPETLREICTETERQAAVLGLAQPATEAPDHSVPIRYVPCPVCHKLMNRVNFARSSNVIVDVCKAHGNWFDKDELRRAVEFIRAGGLERARSRELAEIQEQRRKLAAEKGAFADAVLRSHEVSGSSPETLTDILNIILRE